MTPRKRRTAFYPYRVRLACGHVVAAMNEPLSATARYGCEANQGCGYSLAWTSCWSVDSPDHVVSNPLSG